MKSFYWYDFETSGIDPAMDWPMQFAGIRTDSDLNEIGEPLNIFCKIPKDHLPHPLACLITGLDPWMINEKGLVEPEFIKKIHDEFVRPGTCVVGYNSIRFDDEVTRHSLYRNFYDPYAREWQNGNSRWDLIDLVRLVAALRPEGINWPVREDGYKSFKLEELTAANGIDHGAAHDALSDVRATIALARLIKAKQPKVYDFVLKNRSKREAGSLLNLVLKKPVVHVSGMFGAEKHCLSVVMPLVDHPVNRNGIIVYDLTVDPQPLLSLSVEQIKERVFTRIEDLDDGSDRIPLKVVHLNKCPVLAPINVLGTEDCQRLQLDMNRVKNHAAMLQNRPDVPAKISAVFSERPSTSHEDPDLMLYSGGFFSPADKQRMSQLITTPPEKLSELTLSFDDGRLDEMLLRYRGRHYQDTLDPEERVLWQQICTDRLTRPGERRFGFHEFQAELEACKANTSEPDKHKHLDKLSDYANALRSELQLDNR